MIEKTQTISPDGGQAGSAIYKYYRIISTNNGLEGWGMYMHNNEDVAFWSEEGIEKTMLYKNNSVNIANEKVAIGNFVQYIKSKSPAGTKFERVDVDSSDI